MLRVERSFLFNYHDHVGGQIKEEIFMAFFNSVVTVLQTLVIALGAENAREILANMGKNIDVIAGIFDETMLELRGCDGTEISREPFCVAVSIHHRLAKKEKITLDDLAGENLMLMKRGWSYYGDMLRDDMMKNHPEINIVDFNLYNVEAFNRCENNNEVLLAFKSWESVHPLIRIIPVEWDYTMPFGILHSKKPSIKVKRLINAINKVK